MDSKSIKRKRGKKPTKDKQSMPLQRKNDLLESDKGSYYNQVQLHEQLLNEDNEESSDTDSSIDFGNQTAVCRKCHVGSLKLENLPGQRGLCSRLQWNCNNCNHKCEFYSDSNTGYGSGHSKDINRLSVMAMRTIGKSRNALLKFCSIMDLPAPINYKPF
ncbi:Hypothetical predicted protein [Mytilus galloprovincialis]|uniref:Mutator-like transposase domain-containing protein n=1 Tax=Mytilus galloprovincialis TaxID=29158 RepID=A0A8B6DB84_MYTGA|nr:Hypothetical predicted protein [Mytilus galloprovincialis]